MRQLRELQIALLATCLVGSLLTPAAAHEEPFGVVKRGLHATLTTSQDAYRTGEPIDVTVSLMNVSDSPVAIDAWPGNWFVDVTQAVVRSDGLFVETVTSIRAADVLRPLPVPVTLQPGEPWRVKIKG